MRTPPLSAPQKVIKQADQILQSLKRAGMGNDSPRVVQWTQVKKALESGSVGPSLLQEVRNSLKSNREAYDEGDYDLDGDGTLSDYEERKARRQVKRLSRIFRSLEILYAPPAWMSSWGPWDDLPYRTRKRIHNIPALHALVVTAEEAKGSGGSYMMEASTGISSDAGPYGGGNTVTWTGRVHGVINQPAGIMLSDPRITFKHRFSDSKTHAGITYRVDDGTGNVRYSPLDNWQNLDFSGPEFSSTGLTGKFYHTALPGSSIVLDHHFYIAGRVNRPGIVGVYKAER